MESVKSKPPSSKLSKLQLTRYSYARGDAEKRKSSSSRRMAADRQAALSSMMSSTEPIAMDDIFGSTADDSLFGSTNSTTPTPYDEYLSQMDKYMNSPENNSLPDPFSKYYGLDKTPLSSSAEVGSNADSLFRKSSFGGYGNNSYGNNYGSSFGNPYGSYNPYSSNSPYGSFESQNNMGTNKKYKGLFIDKETGAVSKKKMIIYQVVLLLFSYAIGIFMSKIVFKYIIYEVPVLVVGILLYLYVMKKKTNNTIMGVIEDTAKKLGKISKAYMNVVKKLLFGQV